MMNHRFYLVFTFFALTVFAAGCKKDSATPPVEGELLLSSEKISADQSYYVKGYSLELGVYVNYLAGGGTGSPDWVLSENIDPQSNPVGVNIESPGNSNAFYKAGAYSNAEEVSAAFASLKEVTQTGFVPTAQNLKAFELYIYKSASGKFAKFWVKKIQKITSQDTPAYFEVTLVWVYQRDGGSTFPE